MKNCANLYFLSALACQISECFSEEEVELLAASLQALGELLDVTTAQQAICKKSEPDE